MSSLTSSSPCYAALLTPDTTDTGRTPFELELELTLVLRHVDALFKASDFEGLEKIDRHNLASGSIVKPIGAVVIIGGVEGAFRDVSIPCAQLLTFSSPQPRLTRGFHHWPRRLPVATRL